MPDDFFDPHFDGFPSSEAGEEVEFFDFLIDLFFLEPVLEVDELDGFSVEVVAESFFADGVVLEIGLFVFGLDLLVVDDFKLVDIVGFGSGGGMTDEVKELIDVGDVFGDQWDVLLQGWRLQVSDGQRLRLIKFLFGFLCLFLDNLILLLSCWLYLLSIVKKTTLILTFLFLFHMPRHLLH